MTCWTSPLPSSSLPSSTSYLDRLSRLFPSATQRSSLLSLLDTPLSPPSSSSFSSSLPLPLSLRAPLLHLLEALDTDKIFSKVPTDRIAPHYSSTISSPMSLELIRASLSSLSLDRLHRDVKLMAHNCVTYNSVLAPLGKYALKFLSRWLVCYRLLSRKLNTTSAVVAAAPTTAGVGLKIPKRKREDSSSGSQGLGREAAGDHNNNSTATIVKKGRTEREAEDPEEGGGGSEGEVNARQRWWVARGGHYSSGEPIRLAALPSGKRFRLLDI